MESNARPGAIAQCAAQDRGAWPFGEGVGVVVVDHGSRKAPANDMLLEVVEHFQALTGAAIVEPAHMELAEPSIPQAFARCVERGAVKVVIHPYFLAPGRHSMSDIPEMAAEAAAQHPGIPYVVTAPLGIDEGLMRVMERRVREALPQLHL